MTLPTEPMDPQDPRYADTYPHQHYANGAPVQPVQPVHRVDDDSSYAPSWRGWRASQVVYTIGGILNGLILIRIILELLAANPNAGFTSFLYGLTEPFVAPFQGVFATPHSNGSILDVAAILAIVVYALLTWAIARLLELAQRRSHAAA